MTQKKLKGVRVEILYLSLCMPILVAMACLGPLGNLSLHRGIHQWKQSVVATMERSQLDMGWPPYHPPVCT